jgi:hypothetical protein
LDAVAGKLGAERILLVTAARPTPGIEQRHQAVRITLPPLTLEQVTTLLASLGALRDELSADLPHLLLDASGGSPLLALESLQAAMDTGVLELREGGWVSPDPKALAERLTKGSAVRDRVALLERGHGWLLLLLSTGGLPVSTEVLGAATGRPSEAATEDLVELERRGFVQRTLDGWEPAHDAIGEAATEHASSEARRAAAAALGSAMVRETIPPHHIVARAAQLLAQGDDATLHDLFRRWVQARRRLGDRRRPAVLATELLGEGGKAQARTLETGLPLHTRLGVDTPGHVAAVAISLAAVGLATQTLLTRPQPVPPDAVLVAIADTPRRPGTWRAELRHDAWDPRDDIQLRPTRHSLAAVMRESRPAGPVSPAPDGRSWIVERVFADSGGIDLLQVFTDGRPSLRLTHAQGDDGAASGASWAPDGSAFAFTTARWSPLSRYDVAVLDVASGTIRPLTSGDGADGYPSWSPDGSRVGTSKSDSAAVGRHRPRRFRHPLGTGRRTSCAFSCFRMAASASRSTESLSGSRPYRLGSTAPSAPSSRVSPTAHACWSVT